MVQHFHRGIYEHLWSEHRYLVFARSLKHHDNTRAKLGRVLHVFSFLKSLARAALEPKTEMTQAVLHLYMHIKDQLDRKQRMELVEKILASDDEAMRRIYQLGITASDNAVIGSRLFFTGKALFKIWDNIDTPGLWICMGCFQIHLDPQEALQRVSILSGLSLPAILKVMKTLSQGIPESDYSLLDERLRSALENHLMVAKSGGTAWLSPRVPLRFCSADRWVELPTGSEEEAGFALEAYWDHFPETTGILPELEEWETWARHIKSTRLSLVCRIRECSSSWSFLKSSFDKRMATEQAGTPDQNSSHLMAEDDQPYE